MQLSWTTFVLEIINFLVLVWILKRFLYKPILNIIAQRQSGIEQSLTQAAEQSEAAQQLQQQYENRLADWEQQKQQKQNALNAELEAERLRLLNEVQVELDQEREKSRITEQRLREDTQRRLEQVALENATYFTTQLLTKLAGPELETRIIDVLLDQVNELPEHRIASLRASCANNIPEVVVSSAYRVNESKQQQLQECINTLASCKMPIRYEQDNDLIAGIRLTIDAWVLQANIAGELKGFAEFADVST